MTPRLNVLLMLIPLICGCGRSERTELEKTRAELMRLRDENTLLKAQVVKSSDAVSTGYLEELERLASLMEKKVLTQEEFERRKQAILDGQKLAPVGKPQLASGVEELARQLQTLHSLYNASTITLQERDAKKAQLIGQPLEPSDLKKDLETVKALYNASVITLQEQETLKQKVLGLSHE